MELCPAHNGAENTPQTRPTRPPIHPGPAQQDQGGEGLYQLELETRSTKVTITTRAATA